MATAIRERELTCVEVHGRAPGADRARQPALNAIVTLDAERRAAPRPRAADAALARGDAAGPLHGLPIAHKDLVDTAGHPHHVRLADLPRPRARRGRADRRRGCARPARSSSARRTRRSSAPARRPSTRVFGADAQPLRPRAHVRRQQRRRRGRGRGRHGRRWPTAPTSAARCATRRRSATSSGCARRPAASRTWPPRTRGVRWPSHGPMARSVARRRAAACGRSPGPTRARRCSLSRAAGRSRRRRPRRDFARQRGSPGAATSAICRSSPR